MARDDDSAPFRNASLALAKGKKSESTGNEPDGKQNVLNPTAVSNRAKRFLFPPRGFAGSMA